MRRQNPKLIFKIMLGIFLLSLVATACNNSSENKSTSDSTSPKMDTTSKMDTASTRPVHEGN